MARVTTVGTSPTTTPTFFGLEKPGFWHLERHLSSLGSSEVEHSLDSSSVDGCSSPNSECAFKSNWDFPSVQQQREDEARASRRMTKLEKILGEPVNVISGYAGLGVEVVTEVFEDIEDIEDIDAGDYHLSSFMSSEMSQSEDLPSSPLHWNSFHSRSSSSQGAPSPASSRPLISSSPTAKHFLEPFRPPARANTTYFDAMHNLSTSISSTMATGKWRLDKLHRFLGDVTHSGGAAGHQRQAIDEYVEDMSSDSISNINMRIDRQYTFAETDGVYTGAHSSGSISNIHMPMDRQYTFPETAGVSTGAHNASYHKTMLPTMHVVESPAKEAKRRPSSFMISPGNRATSQSVDQFSRDQGSRPSYRSSTQPLRRTSIFASASLPPSTPVSFGRRSYRSARRLENSLGDQTPSSTTSNIFTFSTPPPSSSSASHAPRTPYSGMMVGWHHHFAVMKKKATC
ncbi:hypothetical protein MJO29_015870 [Puccinia striiformis f. sp. tritici]|nr:hypothetical protein MJO29_015870 [Puccinia striiformis f. sp. tritici]